MHPNNAQLKNRAEYYLFLARALQAPMSEADYQAFRDWLIADIQDIATDAGYSPSPHLTALDEAISAHATDHLSLLRTYSDLFMVPPAKVFLNAGVYLDQAMMAAHTAEMIEFYLQHGVDKSDDFRNMPDHVSVQLEFVAYLLLEAVAADADGNAEMAVTALRGARNFIGRYLAPWLPTLLEALSREATRDPRYGIYLAVAGILQQAVQDDIAWLDANYTQHGDDVAAADCVAGIDTPEAMQAMIERLQAAGLDTTHLHGAAASVGMKVAGNA